MPLVLATLFVDRRASVSLEKGRISMFTRKTVRLLPLCLLAGISLFAFPAYAVTFGPVINVSHSRPDAGTPGIAVNGSYVHIAWSEDSTVYYSRSIDSGSTFGGITQLFSVSASAAGYGSTPAVAASGSNVYVARSQRPKPSKPSQVYFRRSINNGASFGSQVQLSNGSGDAQFRGMAVSGNKVYIVWTEWVVGLGHYAVFMARSIDGGATFPTTVNLSDPPPPTNAPINDVALLAVDGNVYVAWTPENAFGRLELLFRSSRDSGETFNGVISISSDATTNSTFPALAAAGSYVYLAYKHTNVFVAQLFVTDADVTFVGAVDVSHVPAGFPPRISANGSDVQVIWSGTGPTSDVFYTHSNTSGTIYSTLNVSNGTNWFGVVASDGANVYLSWSDGSEIYLAHSSDGGNLFEPTMNVSGNAGASNAVVTVATPTEIYHVWIDRTPGNADVFYRRGTLPP
jgi:hypothetical protein